jgi:hypothetical protein
LAGFGPVPNCGQAVAFPPAAAPWVGYRRETRLTLPGDGSAVCRLWLARGRCSLRECDVSGHGYCRHSEPRRLRWAASLQCFPTTGAGFWCGRAAPGRHPFWMLPGRGALGFAGVV